VFPSSASSPPLVPGPRRGGPLAFAFVWRGLRDNLTDTVVISLIGESLTQPDRRGHMPTEAELQAELERLKAENAALKSRGSKGVSMKVSEKGGVSVYGLGRFPVTLYQEQWLKLLDLADDIRGFIRENDGRLKKKE
jgi:hypothetical protein